MPAAERPTGGTAAPAPFEAGAPPPRRRLKPRHFAPLAGFVVPTLAIGYGVVIPRSCIAGWNPLSTGFAATVLGASLAYWAGLRAISREGAPSDGQA